VSSSGLVAERPDFALIKRLRQVLRDEPATETELRSLSEQADGWARALDAQVQASERRLRELNADPLSPLSEAASELRRIETLRPQLDEIRSLVSELEQRAREFRTAWLLHQAESARPLAGR